MNVVVYHVRDRFLFIFFFFRIFNPRIVEKMFGRRNFWGRENYVGRSNYVYIIYARPNYVYFIYGRSTYGLPRERKLTRFAFHRALLTDAPTALAIGPQIINSHWASNSFSPPLLPSPLSLSLYFSMRRLINRGEKEIVIISYACAEMGRQPCKL